MKRIPCGKIFLSFAFLLLAAPASAEIIYSEFSGYREWPIMPDSMADTACVIPVYRTWPHKAYEVLGSLKYDNQNDRWEQGDIKQVAKEAKKRKGEAIILRRGGEESVYGIAGVKTVDYVRVNFQPTALVIRFLSKEEIARRDAAHKRVFRDYIAKHPTAGFSEETSIMAFKFLLQSGHKYESPDLPEKFGEIMGRIAQMEPGSLTGEWLFKSVLKTSNITTSNEKSDYGTATVQSDGTNVVVVSIAGGIEMNFSGACTGARFSGQVGIAGYSAKAEGIALDTKISLTYQTVTASGTAQGSIVLQRIGLTKEENRPATEKLQKL